MNSFPTQEQVNSIKAMCPPGTRVRVTQQLSLAALDNTGYNHLLTGMSMVRIKTEKCDRIFSEKICPKCAETVRS